MALGCTDTRLWCRQEALSEDSVPLNPLVNHHFPIVNMYILGIVPFSDNPVDHICLTDFGAGAAERIRVRAQIGPRSAKGLVVVLMNFYSY